MSVDLTMLSCFRRKVESLKSTKLETSSSNKWLVVYRDWMSVDLTMSS
jgi:hypothetical protein